MMTMRVGGKEAARVGSDLLSWVARRSLSTSPAELKKTKLFDYLVSKGGKMVEFGGYAMPLQFGSVGIIDSHKKTRSGLGIFDVSHMLQLK